MQYATHKPRFLECVRDWCQEVHLIAILLFNTGAPQPPNLHRPSGLLLPSPRTVSQPKTSRPPSGFSPIQLHLVFHLQHSPPLYCRQLSFLPATPSLAGCNISKESYTNSKTKRTRAVPNELRLLCNSESLSARRSWTIFIQRYQHGCST